MLACLPLNIWAYMLSQHKRITRKLAKMNTHAVIEQSPHATQRLEHHNILAASAGCCLVYTMHKRRSCKMRDGLVM
jgi:hypothetical protein